MLTKNAFDSNLSWLRDVRVESLKPAYSEPLDKYLEWFMPFCEEIRRVLKKSGSFVLDIGGA